jgi:hypothetical protein
MEILDPERTVPAAGMVQFTSGTLIIPLDRHADELDVLPSYGLVYHLLGNGVPVQWAIKANKTALTDADVQIDAGVAVTDFFNDTVTIPTPVQYGGGAFLIDASDAAAARPRIQAWQAAHAKTVVHTVNGTFAAHIIKTLTAALPIAGSTTARRHATGLQRRRSRTRAAGRGPRRRSDHSHQGPDVRRRPTWRVRRPATATEAV